MADAGSSMIDATAAAGDPTRLKALLAEHGYLLLRGALNRDLVQRVRDDLIAVLHECNILESPAAPPIWSGGPAPTEEEYMAYYERAVQLDSFNRLAESAEVRAVMEAIYDGPVQVWEQRLLRIIPPDPDGAAPLGVGAHQDGSPQLGYLTQDFSTAWIPLTDIDERLGGLAVVPGSHRGGVRAQTGSASSSLRTAKTQTFEAPSAGEQWVTTTYSPGDLVVFSQHDPAQGPAQHLGPAADLLRLPLPAGRRLRQLARAHERPRGAARGPADRCGHHQPRAIRDHPRRRGPARRGAAAHAGRAQHDPGASPRARRRAGRRLTRR